MSDELDTTKSEWYTLETWIPKDLGWVPLTDVCYDTEDRARTALYGYFKTNAVIRVVKSTKEVIHTETRTYPKSRVEEKNKGI